MNKLFTLDPKVGDVLVSPARRYVPERRYVVIKVARVKIYAVFAEHYERYLNGTYNFNPTVWRKDTGYEDGAAGVSGPRVYTPEQLLLLERESLAKDYLKTLGIEISWLRQEVLDPLTLANLIRTHLNEKEL